MTKGGLKIEQGDLVALGKPLEAAHAFESGDDAAVAAGTGGELLHGAEGLRAPLLGDGESRRVAYAGDGVEGRADGPVLDDEPGAL